MGTGLIAIGSAGLLIPDLFGSWRATRFAGPGTRGWWSVITLMQLRTPSQAIGRVASALYLLVFFPTAVSALLGAGLIQLLGFRALIAVASVAAGGRVRLRAGSRRERATLDC
ncbi:MAG: hypothetical protein JWN03_4333 [Nocardia sp.]|uniref:hypothetical protein n=1 Tax=Nocardia sp. TaxID=1821 RepID=UPI0026213799|nr:hypothetical protein [Nocardia sp.]MCU1644058.1 hypothetical protein [Nocardia sp.]